MGQDLPREVAMAWSFIRMSSGSLLNSPQASPPFSFIATFPIVWRVSPAREAEWLAQDHTAVSGEAGFQNGSVGLGEAVLSAADL